MVKKCQYRGCGKAREKNGSLHCSSHVGKITADRFLGRLYSAMKKRVTTGINTNTPHLYVGKPIMPKDAFLSWSKNHPDFLTLYKRWVSCNFDRKLTPVVNRLQSSGGYVLGNVEWVTNSQNSVMAGSVRRMKARKEIYDLLGVNKHG